MRFAWGMGSRILANSATSLGSGCLGGAAVGLGVRAKTQEASGAADRAFDIVEAGHVDPLGPLGWARWFGWMPQVVAVRVGKSAGDAAAGFAKAEGQIII